MRRRVLRVLVAAMLAAVLLPASAAFAGDKDCTAIKDGTLEYSAGHYLAGEPLVIGYDDYGYNYKAHSFNGTYFNYISGRLGFPAYTGDEAAYIEEHPSVADHWAWEYRDVSLAMKWNDAWLANTDCDGDGALDRHYGFPTYSGSGAWLTNHTAYEEGFEFVKIVAAPADATVVDGVWYAADGTEIGPVIWGAFAIVQEVYGGEGATYVSPSGSGFGGF